MSGNPQAMRMAEAAVTRLCHDVSGSIGAVLSGLELAAAGDEAAEEAMQIAAEAAREVAARMRLARAVWDVDSTLDTDQLGALATGLPNHARLQLDCTGLAQGTLPPNEARLLLVVLIMAAEALHGRGTIAVAGEPSREILFVIDGVRAAWHGELPALLANPQACWSELDPRALSVPLAVLLANEAGARLSLLLSVGASEAPPPLLLSFRR